MRPASASAMLPFLTAYDPLGSTSGSIDPLGALQTYTSLADLLLPGVTTITTRSRYLSMICAAIGNAEKYRAFLPGASGLAQRRRAVEPFERLWAIACVAARDDGSSEAADGLRGITYAEKIYRQFAATFPPVCACLLPDTPQPGCSRPRWYPGCPAPSNRVCIRVTAKLLAREGVCDFVRLTRLTNEWAV
jgi:hypothetical protein